MAMARRSLGSVPATAVPTYPKINSYDGGTQVAPVGGDVVQSLMAANTPKALSADDIINITNGMRLSDAESKVNQPDKFLGDLSREDMVMLGLSMMSNASKPGATLLGSLGDAGLSTSKQRKENERERQAQLDRMRAEKRQGIQDVISVIGMNANAVAADAKAKRLAEKLGIDKWKAGANIGLRQQANDIALQKMMQDASIAQQRLALDQEKMNPTQDQIMRKILPQLTLVAANNPAFNVERFLDAAPRLMQSFTGGGTGADANGVMDRKGTSAQREAARKMGFTDDQINEYLKGSVKK